MKSLSKKRNHSPEKNENDPQSTISQQEQNQKKEENPNFLLKLYHILETPEYKDIIHWNDNGKSFIVQNLHDFTENILPKYYKHNNYSSFVRQLNMYDFHKKRNGQNEHIFQHKNFIRGEKDLIKTIKRKNKKELLNNKQERIKPFKTHDTSNEQALIGYCNGSLGKKVTKNSLEKALNYLIKSVNENTDKQRNLEEKVEKLGKQNEDFLLQNKKMLQEIITKTEYNKKLEAVVCFILEMIVKKPTLKGGNDLKNVLISNDMNNISLPEMEVDIDNIEKVANSNPNNLKDMNNLMMPLIQKNNLNCINTDSFQNFLDKYIERNKNRNNALIGNDKIPLNNKINVPMITNGQENKTNIKRLNSGSLNQTNIQLSPIRVNNSRRGSIDSFNNFTNNFDIKKPLLANSSNLSINGDYDNCTNNNNICDNSILSNNSKNIFDLEFNTNGSNDLNKSNLNINMSSLNNSIANIFENPDDNNNLTEKDEDQKDLKRLFD